MLYMSLLYTRWTNVSCTRRWYTISDLPTPIHTMNESRQIRMSHGTYECYQGICTNIWLTRRTRPYGNRLLKFKNQETSDTLQLSMSVTICCSYASIQRKLFLNQKEAMLHWKGKRVLSVINICCSCTSLRRKLCLKRKAGETYKLSISAYVCLNEKDKVCHCVLQCKAVRRNAVQCAAVAMRQWDRRGVLPFVAACSAVQCSAMCRCSCYSMKRMQCSCSVVHCGAVQFSVLHSVTPCCSLWQCLQCAAACCSTRC